MEAPAPLNVFQRYYLKKKKKKLLIVNILLDLQMALNFAST